VAASGGPTEPRDSSSSSGGGSAHHFRRQNGAADIGGRDRKTEAGLDSALLQGFSQHCVLSKSGDFTPVESVRYTGEYTRIREEQF
jgi:hypothetical protein